MSTVLPDLPDKRSRRAGFRLQEGSSPDVLLAQQGARGTALW